jgi:hypothetical protein
MGSKTEEERRKGRDKKQQQTEGDEKILIRQH